MKKGTKYVLWSGLLIALLLTVFVGWVIGRGLREDWRSVAAEPQQLPLVATPDNLKPLGLTFTPVDAGASEAQGIVTEEQAVAAAVAALPQLGEATGVSASLGFMVDLELQRMAGEGTPGDPGLTGMSLVWALTFHGIESVSSGPPGAEHYVAHDLAAVVEAKTGRFIMAFTISDVAHSLASPTP